MSRRWKITFALFVLGIGGLLGWALLSPVTPPFSVHFCGYVTNHTSPFTHGLGTEELPVFALFAATNQSHRALYAGASAEPSPKEQYLITDVMWLEMGSGFHVIQPGEGAILRARVWQANEPLRITIRGVSYRASDTIWNRLAGWMSRDNGYFSVTATNEPP